MELNYKHYLILVAIIAVAVLVGIVSIKFLGVNNPVELEAEKVVEEVIQQQVEQTGTVSQPSN